MRPKDTNAIRGSGAENAYSSGTPGSAFLTMRVYVWKVHMLCTIYQIWHVYGLLFWITNGDLFLLIFNYAFINSRVHSWISQPFPIQISLMRMTFHGTDSYLRPK